MRGLHTAGVLLTPALAGAISAEDSIPRAFISVPLPEAVDSAPSRDLVFRFDINESQDACGYGNVTINGQKLSEDGKGPLTLDGDRVVDASWNFTCVTWNDKPQEQLLSLNVDHVNGQTVDDAGFTIRFQQVAPVWISDVEGSASMTRVHSNRQGQPEPDCDDKELDLDAELAELDYLRVRRRQSMEAEGDQGLMGLTGRVLILTVQVTSTVAALITALESPAMGTTPRMAHILTRLLLTERSLTSLTLHPSASVGCRRRRRRRTMVSTHLHHHITVITRLLLRRLLTGFGLLRRHRHRHHMAISRRLLVPASALLHLTTAVLGFGRACSDSSIHMDPHRQCLGNGQTRSTRLRTVIRITATATDTREDHLAWDMRITTALLMKIARKSTVTTKVTSIPMSLNDSTNPKASPTTWTMTITSLPTISKDLRPRPRSKKLAAKTGICLWRTLRSLKSPGPDAPTSIITPTCPGRLSSDGITTTGPHRMTVHMITMSSTVTTLPLLGLRPLVPLHLDLLRLLDITPMAHHLTRYVRKSIKSPRVRRNSSAPWYKRLCFGPNYSELSEDEEKEAMLRNCGDSDSDSEDDSDVVARDISQFRTAADVVGEMVAVEEARMVAHSRQPSFSPAPAPVPAPVPVPQQHMQQQHMHPYIPTHLMPTSSIPMPLPMPTGQLSPDPATMAAMAAMFPDLAQDLDMGLGHRHGGGVGEVPGEELPAYQEADRQSESDESEFASSMVTDGYRPGCSGSSYTPSECGSQGAGDILGDTKN
ncbi:hypothetical protein INS49_000752 [Diaporthe citri]|uniref:uncharacterized protein n=1 Tax=Diaporthe citri TaxID=83186 RepID=UPI001C81DEC5|nr:uncharacterized protein INS49_000752 [Diaporthe citri]KAG6366574.1 hypothetical protein INS49_000752 [Diaporthe citri]